MLLDGRQMGHQPGRTKLKSGLSDSLYAAFIEYR
jgi:hypothetical protein